VRPQDGAQVEINWKAGEIPRFEIIRRSDFRVMETHSLVPMKSNDFEKLLKSYGFIPAFLTTEKPSSASR